MQYFSAHKVEIDRGHDAEMPLPGHLRVQGYLVDDDFESDLTKPDPPPSLYSNGTVLTARRANPDKSGSLFPFEDSSLPDASGTFGRLLRSAGRKPAKHPGGASTAHAVTLNLHQFQMANGESLGEDSDRWARLTF